MKSPVTVHAGPPLEVPDVNLAQILFDTAARHGARPGFHYRDPASPGTFRTLAWAEVAERVKELAHGLLALGLQKGDRVAILADTRVEWALADYAVLAAAGVTVTIYPTSSPPQIRYLLKDSGSRFVFVENAAQFAKVEAVAPEVAHVERWILFEPATVEAPALKERTLLLSELAARGRAFAASSPSLLAERTRSVRPDDLATLVYTSGTTGVPKGAMLSHRNFVASATAGIAVLAPSPHPAIVAFLPLAHVYGRFVVFAITQIAGEITFSKPSTLGADLQAVQPTLMASVPRIYERMYHQIKKAVSEQPRLRRRIFAAAEATAKAYGRARSGGGTPGPGLRLRHALFERLVYAKLRERIGMGRLESTFTSSAAIRPDLLYFYQGIGVNILEAYGLTETAAPATLNPPGRFKVGTVGKLLPGLEGMLAEDGELFLSGPFIFLGYYDLPIENEAAFTVIDGKRWFRTGDLAVIDEDGYIRIVDRKKELEVLDTGKKIAPVMVEEALKESSFIAEAMLVATGRKYAGCLIQPNFDRLVAWAKERGIPFDASKVVVAPDPTGQPMVYRVGRDLLDRPEVRRHYQAILDGINPRFADFERVKAFCLADHVFTIDRDELTISLKKKRRNILKNYGGLVESMFNGPAEPAPSASSH